jgi:hypothetical protein
MFIVKVMAVSAVVAIAIKQIAIFLPIETFSPTDLNTIAFTAITIPVVIFASLLFWRG